MNLLAINPCAECPHVTECPEARKRVVREVAYGLATGVLAPEQAREMVMMAHVTPVEALEQSIAEADAAIGNYEGRDLADFLAPSDSEAEFLRRADSAPVV